MTGRSDRPRIRVRAPWMVWYAAVLHLWWAAMLAVDPRAVNTTTLHGFAGVMPARTLAAAMAGVALVAVWPLVRPPTPHTIWWLVPQQALLIVAAQSAGAAMIASKFGDGVIRPRAFIAADQAPAVIAAVLHTCAIVDRWTSDRRITRALRALNDGPA